MRRRESTKIRIWLNFNPKITFLKSNGISIATTNIREGLLPTPDMYVKWEKKTKKNQTIRQEIQFWNKLLKSCEKQRTVLHQESSKCLGITPVLSRAVKKVCEWLSRKKKKQTSEALVTFSGKPLKIHCKTQFECVACACHYITEKHKVFWRLHSREDLNCQRVK